MSAERPPLDYVEIGVLGRGFFGKAILVQRRGNGEKMVVKQIPFEGMDHSQVAEAIGEVKALKLLVHPNIVRYRGCFISSGGRVLPDDPVTYWEKMDSGIRQTGTPPPAPAPDMLNIITEYVDGGSLDDLLRRNAAAPLEELLIAMWLAQLVLAVDQMHKSGTLHRDLKPANIFITRSGIVKVGDLGGCVMVENLEDPIESEYGSPIFICPEVWQSSVCSHKSDVWSLGCIVYMLMAQRPPFEGHGAALRQRVLHQKHEPPPEQYSKPLRDLVDRMLEKDPAHRPSCRDLRQDSYVAECVALWMRASCGCDVVPLKAGGNEVSDIHSTLRHAREEDMRDPGGFLLRRTAKMRGD